MARLAERDLMIRYLAKVNTMESQLLIGAIGDGTHYITNAAKGTGGGISPSKGERPALESIGESARPYLTSGLGDRFRRALSVAHKGRAVSRTFEGRHSSFRHDMR